MAHSVPSSRTSRGGLLLVFMLTCAIIYTVRRAFQVPLQEPDGCRIAKDGHRIQTILVGCWCVALPCIGAWVCRVLGRFCMCFFNHFCSCSECATQLHAISVLKRTMHNVPRKRARKISSELCEKRYSPASADTDTYLALSNLYYFLTTQNTQTANLQCKKCGMRRCAKG